MVTADWRAGLGGFFIQDAGDGDDATSDALFVQAAGESKLAVGDRVRVRGVVIEMAAGPQAALTTLKAERIEVLGRAQALPLRELNVQPVDWRALEGERVRITAPLTLSGTEALERNGELFVAFGGRLWQPSEVALPGSEAYAEVERDNARRKLVLDDGSGERNPRRSPTCRPRRRCAPAPRCKASKASSTAVTTAAGGCS